MILENSSRILIFAGAGISQESGLSTFRDNGGLWEQYDVMKICNFKQFLVDVESSSNGRMEMFDFYNMRKREIHKAEPNIAHYTIASWQQKFGVDRVKIVTSNIDDLFERAGCSGVVHVHGETEHMHCAACGYNWHIGDSEFDAEAKCPECDSHFTKPNVVFFGEHAPEYATMHEIFNPKSYQKGDIIFYIGSSMTVIPAEVIIRRSGWDKNSPFTILVDTNAKRLADVSPDGLFDLVEQGSAVDVLPTFKF